MSVYFKKFINPDEALGRIKDSSVLAISGFNIATAPEYLVVKLYELYEKTGHPKNLFIISDTFPGAPNRGLDYVAKKIYENDDGEFVRGMLIPYLGWSPWLQKLTLENKIEMYSWSIGLVAYWFREVASGRPGLLTYIGLDTFMDPRQDGGALNELAKERKTCIVEVLMDTAAGICMPGICIEKEFLMYRAPKPNVAFIRGTTADEWGNITMEKEGIFGTILNIAQAAKAQPNPGFVVAQVERAARFGSLNPQEVQVPGPLVDYIVIAPPEYQWQSTNVEFDARICGRIIPPLTSEHVRRIELSDRKVIARRVLMEMVRLMKKSGRQVTVNLGIGIPAMVGNVAAEEEVSDLLVTTIESGPWGGLPLSGADFGVSIGPFAITPMPDMFSNYEGGIIDAASLGFLQVDREGNVNPSMLPNRLPGPGGFPVIAAGAPRVYFAGRFTAGKDYNTKIRDGKLNIIRDGSIQKFVNKVYKIVFSGKMAKKFGKKVLYITERAVFHLGEENLILDEYAPGIDIEKDIIEKMEFKPKVSSKCVKMDSRLFQDKSMGLIEEVKQAFKK